MIFFSFGSTMKRRVVCCVLKIFNVCKTRFPVVPFIFALYISYAIFKPRQFPLSTYEFGSPIENLATAYELETKFSQNHNKNSTILLPTCPIPFSKKQSDDDWERDEFVYHEITRNYSSLLAKVIVEDDSIIRGGSNFNTQLGGKWDPIVQNNCESIQRVALIIPYRNKMEQLKEFLFYIHSFLQLQMIHYKIFVIEQFGDSLFNRGKLFNIGFVEATQEAQDSNYNNSSSTSNYYNNNNGQFYPDCFIFHDVDFLPENLKNLYACTHKPRHMTAMVNIFRYTLEHEDLFDGAISILNRQFQLVNGYSNSYEVWGRENDDMLNRIKLIHREAEGRPIIRFSPEISSYHMISHQTRKPSNDRFSTKIRSTLDTFQKDGLNSLQYKVINRLSLPLYTLIQVAL